MKRLQVMLKDETISRLNEIIGKCNDGFSEGHVKTQDVVEWMLSTSTVDIQKVRLRCLNLKKILSNARIEYKSDVEEFVKKLGLVKPLLKDREEK